MIELNGVSQYYGAQIVLRNVELKFDHNGLVVILGPNGTGKSTLLRVMAGIIQPQIGTIFIDGRRRRSSVEAELAIRQQTVFLPDDVWMPSRMTPLEWLYAVGRTCAHRSIDLLGL